jgi:SMC interacting uncharacterized protein involved in chromosome segregation
MQEEIDKLNIQIEELTKKVNTLERGENIDTRELLLDSLLSNLGDYNSTLERTISIPAGGGNFIVPENPAKTLYINYKGTNYRMFLYSLT